MKRRHFGQILADGAVAVGCEKSESVIESTVPKPKKNLLMHVGGDYHGILGDSFTSFDGFADKSMHESRITQKENLEFNLRCGVKYLMTQYRFLKKSTPEGAWDLDELKMMKENCDRFGIFLEGIRMDSSYIIMKKGPKRDRKIEIIVGNIQKAAQIGMKVISYHWAVIPERRNGHAPGRGGSTYSVFTLEKNWKDLPIGEAGRVTADDYWERITYFLENIIPVAEGYDVKMACHPYDPPGLPFGYMGVDNWDSPSIFEGLKRYAATVESPYNGFQLCVATCYEESCLTGTNKKQVYEIIRYLGERKKIFNIHLRNIKGSPGHFEMVYLDEGDMDIYRIIEILRDVQYPYSIVPDGHPTHPDDKGCVQAAAFSYGYITALIQAANAEAV